MQAALEREAVRNVLRVKRVNGGKGEELECSQGGGRGVVLVPPHCSLELPECRVRLELVQQAVAVVRHVDCRLVGECGVERRRRRPEGGMLGTRSGRRGGGHVGVVGKAGRECEWGVGRSCGRYAFLIRD